MRYLPLSASGDLERSLVNPTNSYFGFFSFHTSDSPRLLPSASFCAVVSEQMYTPLPSTGTLHTTPCLGALCTYFSAVYTHRMAYPS